MKDVDMIRVGELSSRLDIPVRTLQNWCTRGVLVPSGEGKHRRFNKTEVCIASILKPVAGLRIPTTVLREVSDGIRHLSGDDIKIDEPNLGVWEAFSTAQLGTPAWLLFKIKTPGKKNKSTAYVSGTYVFEGEYQRSVEHFVKEYSHEGAVVVINLLEAMKGVENDDA